MTIENSTQPAAAAEEQVKPREYPDVIQQLLDMPPILPTEYIDDFLNIFESFDAAALAAASKAVAIEASQKARKYMSDPAYRKTAAKSFEVAGFGQDAVEAESFSRALPEISTIERLIVSAQRRLNDFLKQLTERHDKRVATMRDTAKLAIEKGS